MMKSPLDVIIIGAGASGLACAKKLMANHLNVLVLEARDRIGGRVHTLNHFGGPVELGAEFIHTAEPDFLQEFSRAGFRFYDVINKRHAKVGDKLIFKENFMKELEKFTERLDAHRTPDRTVNEFIKSQGRRIKSDIKPLLVTYVEGFHAAELDLMGEKALAANEQDKAQGLNKTEMFRPLSGYSPLLSSWLRLESPVTKIEWQKHKVTVHGPSFGKLSAKRAVITLPIGVLKCTDPSLRVVFEPEPVGLRKALEGVHMGHVTRITFEFKSRFWESLTDQPLGFMQAGPSEYFPVWWTQWPLRTHLLVAWQGGPKAVQLARLPQEEQIQIALKTLSKLTHRSTRFLKQHVVNVFMHDWTLDPYSLGAYSYLGLNGARKLTKLLKPMEDTLIFAGEALAAKSAQATVHGAIQSGSSAADLILKSH
jgi:monoamine oxidase